MPSETPDLSRGKLPIKVVVALMASVLTVVVTIAAQVVVFVWWASAFQERSKLQRDNDIEARAMISKQVDSVGTRVDKLSDTVQAQTVVLTRVDGAVGAQASLIEDLRSRLSAVESALRPQK